MLDRKKNQNVHEFQSRGYIVDYNYNPDEQLLEVFISRHSKNRFILLVSNVNAKNSLTEILNENTEFEIVANQKTEELFWSNNLNAAMNRNNNRYNQLFVKIPEVAKNGIHLIIKNITIY